MANPMVIKIVKGAVGILSMGIPLMTNYFDKKEMNEKIAKEVQKAVTEALKKE